MYLNYIIYNITRMYISVNYNKKIYNNVSIQFNEKEMTIIITDDIKILIKSNNNVMINNLKVYFRNLNIIIIFSNQKDLKKFLNLYNIIDAKLIEHYSNGNLKKYDNSEYYDNANNYLRITRNKNNTCFYSECGNIRIKIDNEIYLYFNNNIFNIILDSDKSTIEYDTSDKEEYGGVFKVATTINPITINNDKLKYNDIELDFNNNIFCNEFVNLIKDDINIVLRTF